uniref:Recombination protein RecR n=1 Tax=Soboliphyme baturini TaxID=241478 RepID=A0A183IA52_9BILA
LFLVVGPHYLPVDIELDTVSDLDKHTSGICLIGINDGCSLIQKVRSARLLATYLVRGRLGRATLDQTIRGKIIEQTSYGELGLKAVKRTRHEFS